jgi:ribosomal protein S18 acetylase RimI-like enzyme
VDDGAGPDASAAGPTGGPGREVTIRAARLGDVAAMQRLEVDAGRRFGDIGLHSIAGDDPAPAEELAGYVEGGRAWVAVLAHDGEPGGSAEPVGYAIARVVDGEGHLDQVSVGVGHGRRGIGRALAEVVCSWAADQGFAAVTLTTFRDVAWNGPLYRRWGFEVLDGEQLTPELAAIRRAEQARGIDVAPRQAMRRSLSAHPPLPPPGQSVVTPR